MRPLEIFRAGTHTAMGGRAITLSERDVAKCADVYEAALHEAPLVVGHPHSDAPAYGWVKALAADKSSLFASPAQVDPAFAESVRDGRFKKVSASFYLPEAPANPKPGSYYLRHVGFLGAQAPAVKGLKPVAFADGEDGVVTVEFAETELSRLLNELIDKEGDDRDGVIAEMASAAGVEAGTVQQILRGEIERPPEERLRGFARVLDVDLETLQRAIGGSGQTNSATASLSERERKLATREAAIFVEELARRGVIVPRSKTGLVAFMASLSDDGVVTFAEGGETRNVGQAKWFRDFLEAQPPVIEFRERSAPEHEVPGATADFQAPAGFTVDSTGIDLHRRAQAYQREHETDYDTAVRAVSRS